MPFLGVSKLNRPLGRWPNGPVPTVIVMRLAPA